MNQNQLVHTVISNVGVDYDKEVDRATGKKLYIPVVIDDNGGRHRLEALGCRKADDAITTAANAREAVLAEIAKEEAQAKVEKQASVDTAVLEMAQVVA